MPAPGQEHGQRHGARADEHEDRGADRLGGQLLGQGRGRHARFLLRGRLGQPRLADGRGELRCERGEGGVGVGAVGGEGDLGRRADRQAEQGDEALGVGLAAVVADDDPAREAARGLDEPGGGPGMQPGRVEDGEAELGHRQAPVGSLAMRRGGLAAAAATSSSERRRSPGRRRGPRPRRAGPR